MNTVFALATPLGRAGVSIVRVSGPDARNSLTVLCGEIPKPRFASYSSISRKDGSKIDDGLILWFPGPASFTGEDVVEFQVHGSIAVVKALLSELSKLPDFRMAEPGEFTRRALLNGKMGLTEIEGLADLIDAETDAQLRQAQRVFDGVLRDKAENWRKMLIRASALLAATIDFADEEVPEDVSDEVLDILQLLSYEFDKELEGSKSAERVRVGFEVAIVGPPNVGKSTLLNRIAGREAAITSNVAGTTRDVIEVRMEIAGLPVTLLDTAGIRVSEDSIENIGIDRAKMRSRNADIRVFLLDDDSNFPVEKTDGDLVVAPKGDLRKDALPSISGLTGAGIDELLESIGQVLRSRVSGSECVIRERHSAAIRIASTELVRAYEFVTEGAEMYDVACEHLRRGALELESLLGYVDVEDLLDEVFSSFCLGK